MPTCTKCGCRTAGVGTCRDLFDHCLALEFEHPGTYGAVHHLTVLCYMLQHNGYSGTAWLQARRLLERFLRAQVSPEDIRVELNQYLKLRPHGESLTRASGLDETDPLAWSRDVSVVRTGHFRDYCLDVVQWAESVLLDTESLAVSLSSGR